MTSGDVTANADDLEETFAQPRMQPRLPPTLVSRRKIFRKRRTPMDESSRILRVTLASLPRGSTTPRRNYAARMRVIVFEIQMFPRRARFRWILATRLQHARSRVNATAFLSLQLSLRYQPRISLYHSFFEVEIIYLGESREELSR